MFSNWSSGAANRMSSTYLKYIGMEKSNFSIALVSKFLKTRSAIMGDKGEPIGVPKTCLYTTLLNEKNVDSKTNFNAFIENFNYYILSQFYN